MQDSLGFVSKNQCSIGDAGRNRGADTNRMHVKVVDFFVAFRLESFLADFARKWSFSLGGEIGLEDREAQRMFIKPLNEDDQLTV